MKKNILVAPLNWGLGHATRCIPIIKALEENNFTPIIASDGVALALLKKEFPHLIAIELPPYDISYAEKGKNFKWKLLSQMPKMFSAILKERKKTAQIINEYAIDGIISDNRLGVYSSQIPSVFITHQLKVLSGKTSWLTTQVHAMFISKFEQCWVPDNESLLNLTGALGHLKKPLKNVVYVGPLSRFEKKRKKIKYDLMVILSGPEPQRTLLEEKIIGELKSYSGAVIFIKGVVEEIQTSHVEDTITFYNFMNSEQLETAFNQSKEVLCRSGYTTVMDLAKLGKKAFFIPTPGQYEQEYLAEKYRLEGIAPSCTQEKFTIEKLKDLDQYNGLQNFATPIDWKYLFRLF
ncbi:MAG: glycosyltransferase [Flavobacterium sp.]|jgi:uncharacterized protein (TIGR00661 family)|nr:glycosyltransferase [Flavobacterium sp.]